LHRYVTEETEIKCEQDCFYNTVRWDEGCQGLRPHALGSAGAWDRVQRAVFRG